MTDPLDDEVERWRAAQPSPPQVELDRLTHRTRPWKPVGAAAAAVLVVVAGSLVLTDRTGGTRVAAVDPQVLTGQVEALTAGSLTALDIAADQTAFGLDLMGRRCRSNPNGNDVLSPVSAAIALGMLSTGAKGATQSRINRLLHLPPASPALLAAEREQYQDLSALKSVSTSDHLFTAVGNEPERQVLDDLATAFGSDLRTLDFAGQPAQATDAINALVSRDTQGLIPHLFPDPLSTSTATVLTNAIQLSAEWQTPFDPPSPGTFVTASGVSKQVPFLSSQRVQGKMRSSDGWTSLTLPYRGNELEAILLEPPADGSCQLPTPGQLTALSSGHASEETLSMPALHLRQDADLTADLSAMGLPLVNGDYSGFGNEDQEVSQVVQDTFLDVDNAGTKAAAATGVTLTFTALRPGLNADRPYLLLIRDTKTHSPLFLARISDPTAPG